MHHPGPIGVGPCDHVIKLKHLPRYWQFVRIIHWSPVNFPYKGLWRGALLFTLICSWIKDWVNNREAGDLRRHHAHYEVIIMFLGIGDVGYEIPSIKVLFKINAKSHKHPGIKILSSENKTQLVNQRKQNSYRRAYIHIFINIELLDDCLFINDKLLKKIVWTMMAYILNICYRLHEYIYICVILCNDKMWNMLHTGLLTSFVRS